MIKPILYAEDDENDVFLMERAFEKLDLRQPLKTVSDGKQAVAYLSGAAPFANREENPLPCLMLLDLSMPGKNGLEVLQWTRAQPHLAGLPVIVLTSSNQQSDIHRAYLIGANGFMIKPGDPDDLIQILKAIEQNWLTNRSAPATFIDVNAFRPAPKNEAT